MSKSLFEALYLHALILAKCGSYVNINIILSDRYSFSLHFKVSFLNKFWHQLTCLSHLGVPPLPLNFTRIIYLNWRHRTVKEIESQHHKAVWISKLQSFTYEFEYLLLSKDDGVFRVFVQGREWISNKRMVSFVKSLVHESTIATV